MNGYEELGRYVKLTRKGKGIIGERLKVHKELQTMAPDPKVLGKGCVGGMRHLENLTREIMSSGEIRGFGWDEGEECVVRQHFQISEFLGSQNKVGGSEGGCPTGQSGSFARNEEAETPRNLFLNNAR